MAPDEREKPRRRNWKPPVLTWRIGAPPPKRTKAIDKGSKPLPTEQGPLPPAQTANPSDTATKEEEEAEEQQQRKQQALRSRRVPSPDIREITSSLDPFCRLPYLLTPENRSLLHCYLLQVPAHVYGTRPDTVFSAVRDVSLPMSLGSSLTMWWMLIAADGLFAHPGADHSDTVARRKHQAYRLLKHSLSQSSGKVTDDVLGGIIMAAITEARLSDPIACHAHLKGYEAAITARGGLKMSLVDCQIPALRLAHLMPYLVCEPLPAEQEASDEKQVQRFVEFLVSRMNDTTGPNAVSPQVGLAQLKNMVVGLGLLRSGLRFYLQPDERLVARFADEAGLFLALFLVTRTLWTYRESPEDCQLFMSRLNAFFEASTGFDPHTGRPLLTAQGLMCVVIKVIQNLPGMSHSPGGVSTLIHSVDAVQAYRSMTLPSAREQARFILCRILSGYDF